MLANEIGKPYIPFGNAGYSCQTVLSKRINEFLHDGSYYCWFSLQLNPATGGNSSNPLWLYQTLSHAVRTADANDAKVKEIRVALMEAISRDAPISGNPETVKCILEIRHATIELFRPQLWRVNLSSVGDRDRGGYPYPDERKIEDLKWSEFEIVVE